MDLQTLINQHRQKWLTSGKWQDPTLPEALMFATSELGEAFDKFLRLQGGFTRNNEREATEDQLAEEIFDTIMMCVIALDTMGHNLRATALGKLKKMDEKRKIK